MKILILALSVATILTGCAVQRDWQSSGGSKSDGIVKLSYTYGMFQKPETSAAQGMKKAVDRCSRWGYTDAEPFDMATVTCQSYDGNGNCTNRLVTKEYQCL